VIGGNWGWEDRALSPNLWPDQAMSMTYFFGRNDLVATELQEGKAIFVGYSVPCEEWGSHGER
jgi:hypothetical protein